MALTIQNKLLTFIKHPLGVALILGTVIIALLPNYFNKYKVTVNHILENDNELERNYFYDLDGDGVKERIQSSNDVVSGKAMYRTNINTFSIIDQYNWKGKYFYMSNLIFGDYDNNGLSEIYSFTVHNDSLFINGMEYQSERIILNNLFIRKVNKFQGGLDIAVQSRNGEKSFFDINDDGYKEFIFVYQALYSGIPRILYSLDIENGTFNKSKVTGANLVADYIIDIDYDGNKEIICSSTSSANNEKDSAYYLNDYNSWLIVYDQNLIAKRALFKTSNVRSSVRLITLNTDDTTYLFVHTREILKDTRNITLHFLDRDLNTIKSKSYNTDLNSHILFQTANGILYRYESVNENKIYKLDLNLESTLVYEHHDKMGSITIADIENDGKEEFIISSVNSDETTILTHDYKHKTLIPGLNGQFQTLHNSKNEFAIITADNKMYILQYKTNPYYFAKFPFYFAIYILLYLFFYFINKYRKLKLVAANQQMLKLQLGALKNQIDPHFTFNIINSVNMVMAKGDLKMAEAYFSKFSSLLREVLGASDQMLVSLATEVSIIEKYMALQKIRFKDKINFNIEYDPSLDLSLPIPRMLIQEQVENAIKHGIMNKKTNGLIELSVTKQDSDYKITIEDDGIGRIASKKYRENSTGKGTSINLQLLKAYHQIYGVKILYLVDDLMGEAGNASGTRVTFIIPQKK